MRGFVVSLVWLAPLAALGGGCASRSYNAGPEGPGESASKQFFGFGGTKPYELLKKDSAASRRTLADALESSYASLLSSSSSASRGMKVQVGALLAQLRSPGKPACDESELITLYRGHGVGILPPTETGKSWAPSDALFYAPPEYPRLALRGGRAVAEGRSWEDVVDDEWLSRSIDVKSKHEEFASAGAFDAVNRRVFGSRIDPWSFAAVAGRHSFGGWGSPLLSTTLSPTIAAAFSAPFLRLRVCPGRALPTPDTRFSSEQELLVFALLLPEEIAFVHFPEASALTRAIAGNSQTGSAPAAALDAASAELGKRMASFTATEGSRKRTPFEDCLARHFDREESAKAFDRLLAALASSPSMPSKAFLAASTDTCAP